MRRVVLLHQHIWHWLGAVKQSELGSLHVPLSNLSCMLQVAAATQRAQEAASALEVAEKREEGRVAPLHASLEESERKLAAADREKRRLQDELGRLVAAAESGAIVGDRELLNSLKFQRDSAVVELELVREQLAARKLEIDAKNRALAEAQAKAAPVAEAGTLFCCRWRSTRRCRIGAEQATVYHENNRTLRCVLIHVMSSTVARSCFGMRNVSTNTSMSHARRSSSST